MPTILVVDDSAVDRRLVGGLLSRSPGLVVEFATSGDEALEKIAASSPALVLTDLVMPGMSGLDLVSKIHNQYPRLPIILMTGKGSEEIAVDALRAGATSYVPKSSLHALLQETVSDVLAMVRDKRSQEQLLGCLKFGNFTFSLGNDPSLIPSLIDYVQTLLRSIGLCDESDGVRICIALEEALRNGMYHGNLELTSEQREGDPDIYQALLAERTNTPPYSDRQLIVTIKVAASEAQFVVRDQGRGFDPTKLPDPTDPENLEKVSGRGLLLMKTFMDEVRFNDEGNEVTMIKRCSLPATVPQPEAADAPTGG
jgi:CheY-like chemotaxis protein/anti-sigma regulatory factor (Ser/Thr protein kinase)